MSEKVVDSYTRPLNLPKLGDFEFRNGLKSPRIGGFRGRLGSQSRLLRHPLRGDLSSLKDISNIGTPKERYHAAQYSIV
jgi:hypothetical protein